MPKLRIEQIRHLAFEGGGGKGVAFLGALEALEQVGILKFAPGPFAGAWRPKWMPENVDLSRHLISPIKGVAGASAGAITAFLLSCGYSPADIRAIMDSYDFDKFFEKPSPRKVPFLNLDPASPERSGGKEAATPSPKPDDELSFTQRLLLAILKSMIPSQGITEPVARYLGEFGAAAVRRRFNEVLKALAGLPEFIGPLYGAGRLVAVRRLLTDLAEYLDYLPQDMGLFPGYEARTFFAEALAAKLPLLNGEPQFNATFKTHYYSLGEVGLAVTGTNLETGKSELFSNTTTEDFPVADAIRISMSLPLVYKPVVIRREEIGLRIGSMVPDWVAGVWVDGGYLNNIPITAFDHEKIGKAEPDTLGLRLEDDERKVILSFGDLLNVWPIGFGLTGVGESAISQSWGQTEHTINLDTTGLSLLNFKPDKQIRAKVNDRSRKAVFEYFAKP